MSHPVLELSNVSMHFGGIRAVQHLSLKIQEGEIFALIGPNGAGKTTAFNTITGVYQPTHGYVKVFGKDIRGLKAHEITKLGMARTFQNIRLFKDLSVRENIMIAMDMRVPVRSLPSLLRLPAFFAAEEEKQKKVDEILEILSLNTVPCDTEAKNLPYGVQRRLEIARALATGCRILLLDEPAAGMNGQETQKLMETIRFLRDKFQLTILLIEHDMKLVMGISERIAVLEYGKMIAEGTPKAIQEDKNVIRAYLGTDHL